ncbi:Argos [Danaus plexippus plexippus]|uniref:Argos n=1 Tax=Danaus plexippus plexippus TaxID=278856 RepID=A0A212FHP7_DANPL|nr:Argos [Danaus plexippus plexippus]
MSGRKSILGKKSILTAYRLPNGMSSGRKSPRMIYQIAGQDKCAAKWISTIQRSPGLKGSVAVWGIGLVLVDLYDPAQPWIERKCRCLGHRPCSSELSDDDNHTLADKTTLYKTCEPVKRLPKCRYFKDAAWIIYSFPDSNATQQIVNCHCPKQSMTYLLKKLPYTTPSGEQGNQYQFACSPQSRLRCSRKEPCKLFSARRRHEQIDEVNASTICQCPKDHMCPKHHTEPGVLPGVTYIAEDIRTYHGYCMPEPPPDTYRFVGDKD